MIGCKDPTLILLVLTSIMNIHCYKEVIIRKSRELLYYCSVVLMLYFKSNYYIHEVLIGNQMVMII